MTTRARWVSWSTGVLMWAFMDAALAACPVCFQIDDAPTTAGIRAAVVVLMGVTAAVLTAFGVFVTRFVKRERSASPQEVAPN